MDGIYFYFVAYKSDMKTKKIIRDTLILTLVSLLMRGVGLMFSSFLSDTIKAEGLGLLELILSICGFAVSLAGSGIKLTTIRLTVSAQTRGMSVDRTVKMCFAYSLIPASVAAVLLICFAPLAAKMIGHEQAAVCFRLYAISLPFISLSCALSGYFTAVRRAAAYAAVSTGEQLFRIGITCVLLIKFLPYGVVSACAAIIFGQCIAEGLSTLVTYLIYRVERKSDEGKGRPKLSQLLSIALPDSVSSNLRSALVTIRQVLIPKTLKQSGASPAQGLAAYGVVQGMALPVINFAGCIPAVFSGLLIPEIAECVAKDNKKRAERLMLKALRYTFLFSCIVAAAIYIFAPKIGNALYSDKRASFYIRLLAPIIPVSYVDMTTDGILKGLGLQLDSMRFNIIEAAVCLSMVLALVPICGIWGYVAMIFAGEILNFGLSINRLRKYAIK